ncbi:efflux RND transporter periplasmic adaptor subunit [Paenibacillus sp. YIM B09110]|uniref:efflux RND transporter periplasmic adaptor subunit n=1 Tax=Paenibacillus sp. YIM B09110 TaxID=3126102 RepID=UPI00301D31CD
MKKWTIWLGIVIILAAAGAGAYYYYFAKEKEAAGEDPVAQTVTATKGSIVNQISGTGSVAANSRETLTAGKSGTIAEVHVKKGDKVKAGQTLVTFEDSDDYEDQIETIEKNKEKLQETIEGYQEDFKAAIGTEDEEETKKKIQKSIEDTNSEIADLNDDLQDIYEEQNEQVKTVTATIEGEITEFDIEAGDEVQANTTIATIVDYTKLEFVTSVDELDIPSLKVGQAVDITLSSITDRTIDATVSEIAREGSSSNGSSSFEVSILLNDIEGVMAGMSGEAAITIESKEDIVLVPVNAVVEMGGKSFVRVPSTGDGAAAAGGGQTGGGRGQGDWTGEGGQMGEGGGQPPEGGAFPEGEGGQTPASGDTQGEATKGTTDAEAPAGAGAASGGGQSTSGDSGASAGTGQRPNGGGQGMAGGAGETGGTGAAGSSDRQNMRQAMMESLTLGGQLVEVTTGLSNENFVEIVSGLNEGDSVLIPVASGTAGMGGGQQETEVQMQGFPGGGFGGGGFQMQMGGGGGTVRSSTGGGMGGGGMR